MRKLKDIEKYLIKNKIENYRTENGQYVCVNCCSIGDNFYDYGESAPKELKYYSPTLKEIANDRRVKIIMCEDCSGCGNW